MLCSWYFTFLRAALNYNMVVDSQTAPPETFVFAATGYALSEPQSTLWMSNFRKWWVDRTAVGGSQNTTGPLHVDTR